MLLGVAPLPTYSFFLLQLRIESPFSFFCVTRRISLLDGVRHEPLLGAIRAQDVLVVRDEALADHGDLAGGAGEAVVVPVPALERDEAGAADACVGGEEQTCRKEW